MIKNEIYVKNITKGLHCFIIKINRDYFMVGECVRFLLTSCEGSLDERVSAANE